MAFALHAFGVFNLGPICDKLSFLGGPRVVSSVLVPVRRSVLVELRMYKYGTYAYRLGFSREGFVLSQRNFYAKPLLHWNAIDSARRERSLSALLAATDCSFCVPRTFFLCQLSGSNMNKFEGHVKE
jgi:hypothetical protein